ncbi:hypothetical protein [Aestuariivita boseongensis]|uniref:hypothetical protein n=1 Tax=Aestuariivita boseongensis TaxID=1470562 RepID=UPI000682C660|nr:hypothetical protein [Aestuariivita boseongensis]
MTFSFSRIVATAAVLVLFGAASLSAQPAPTDNREQVLDRVREAINKDQRNLRFNLEREQIKRAQAPSGFTNFFLGDSSQDLWRFNKEMQMYSGNTARAESAYRQSLTAEIIADTKGMSQREVEAYLSARANDTFLAKQRTLTNADANLLRRLQTARSDEDRIKARAAIEANLRMRQLEEEVYQAALRRHNGVDDAVRMQQLLRDLSRRNTTLRSTDIADPEERAREQARRQLQTEMEIAEYRRLARSGILRNPQTGRPEYGEARLAMARDAENVLAQTLEERALKPNRYDILSWMLSPDERQIRANTLKKEIASAPEYMALDMLSGSDFGNQGMRFLALSQALKKQQQGVADWRADFVKGTDTGIGAIDNMASVLRTGAADYSRIWDNAGRMSLSQVDARIGRYNEHVDKLSAALAEAGQLQMRARKDGVAVDLSQLSPRARRILTDTKFLVGKPGSERFTINEQSRTMSGLKDGLDLPGDHPLNQINGVNMLEMAATTAIPAAASARVSKLLQGLNVSKAGVAAAAFGTDLATGMALTGLTDYAKTGKVDPARIAIESTLLQTTLGGTGRLTNAVGREFAEQIARNPKTRQAAEFALRNTLGLGSEAALQSYYQSALQGSDMSYEAFLANLMNGALSRGIARTTETGLAKPLKDFMTTLPPDVQTRSLKAHQVTERAKNRAEARLRDVLGTDIQRVQTEAGWDFKLSDRAMGEQLAARMDRALSSGEISWAELKMLYADNPGMKPILQAVVGERAAYFESIVDVAQQRARDELDVEFDRRIAQARETHAEGSPELTRALQRLRQEKVEEERLIATTPKAPGSSNLTSDVDRSIASERVRRHLKDLYRGDREGQYRTPATSAKSYDVNEYIDVFPVIDKIQPRAPELAGIDVTEGDFSGLKHGQAIEAQGMATAMLHMNDAQRAQFSENVLNDAGDKALAQRQLEAAQKSLSSADAELRAEMDRIAAQNPNLQADPKDLALRARDNLYGKKTEAIRKTSNELLHVENEIQALRDQNVPDSDPRMQKLKAERNGLQAQMHRDWGIALREGIETYASFTGLDAIVKDGQIEGNSIRDLINDQAVVRDANNKITGKTDRPYVRVKPGEKRTDLPEGAVQKELSDAQVDSFMRDQIMMMTHHVNDLHKGNEDTVGAASALGKYGERAVLALKFQGKDLNTPPYKSFNEWSEELVANRKDPEALKKVLREISEATGGAGDADHGLREYIKLAGQALPGAQGIWDARKMGLTPSATQQRPDIRPGVRELRSTLANRRRMMEEEEDVLRKFGPTTAAELNAHKQDVLKAELAGLEATKARRAALGKDFLPEDWDKAEALQGKADELRRRMEFQKTLKNTPDALGDPELSKELTSVLGQLDSLRARKTAAGSTGAEPSEDEMRLEARIAAIKDELGVREEAAERFQTLQKERDDRTASAAPLPEALQGEVPTLPAPTVPTSGAATLTVRLGDQSLTIPVRVANTE